MPAGSDVPPEEGKRFIDWNTIPFPSDRLTLGRLRQSAAGDAETLEALIHNVSLLEFEVANEALAMSSPEGGQHQRVRNILLEQKSKELAGVYVTAGLAAGPQEAAQLVAELCTAATAYGRSHSPRGRG